MPVPRQRLRQLRRNQTQAERAAWHLLRDRRTGPKFRRPCRIGPWVVDFYCCEYRLAIEKEDYLRRLGISLLRLPNGFELEDPEGFLRRVREAAMGLALKGPASTPSPALVPRAASPPGRGPIAACTVSARPPGVQPKIWVKISPPGEDRRGTRMGEGSLPC